MREASVSADDIAVQAAKTKLAELSRRDGYAAAMKPQEKRSRTGQLVMLALTILFGALAVISFREIDGTALRWVLGLVLAALAMFSLLAMIGSAPDKPPTAYAAAVLAKSHDQRKSDGAAVHHRVRLLLRDSGEEREVSVLDETLYDVLRTGDVGAAHIRSSTEPNAIHFLVGFVRL